MARFIYLHGETEQFGYRFRKNLPVEIMDDRVIAKLRGNRDFLETGVAALTDVPVSQAATVSSAGKPGRPAAAVHPVKRGRGRPRKWPRMDGS